MAQKILVTGGCGFIGSNFVRMLIAKTDWEVTNLDALTYAGNPANLAELEGNRRYSFVKGDIADGKLVSELFARKRFGMVFNFAAESHVDRSIQSSAPFVHSNVVGTQVLLDAALKCKVGRFVQIGTDEVYGSASSGISFREGDGLNPSSPYSASKAAADLLARSYFVTHGLPVVITRSSNNYGPYQHPEKFIPLAITNLLEGRKIPVYATGQNVRDWLHVQDNCEGILAVARKGKDGEIYNIGAGNEMQNVDVARKILALMGRDGSSIDFIADRRGHDLRYSIDSSKARGLGWVPATGFDEGLASTVEWYRSNPGWYGPLKK